jgi:hypothetical protein
MKPLTPKSPVNNPASGSNAFGAYQEEEQPKKQFESKLGSMKPRSTITQQVKEELDMSEAKPRTSIRNPFSGMGGFGGFGGG